MNNRLRRTLRAQSAMEYLMTYGWAILIIAVVLGALFSLGVFSSGALLGTACVAGPGFQCQTPTISHLNGNLIFTFGQNTGSTLYNIGMACAATSTNIGLPNIASFSTNNGFPELTTTGGPSPYVASPNGNSIGSLTLLSGQTVTVSGLPCYIASGAPLSSSAQIGTTFAGSIWINYTTTQYGTGASAYLAGACGNVYSCNGIYPAGNWLTTKIGTLTVKVS